MQAVYRAAFAASVVALALGGAPALAAPTTFFGEDVFNNGGNNDAYATSHPKSDAARNSFFSNLSGVGTETFESRAAGTAAPFTVSFAGAGSATLTGGTVTGAPQFGEGPISGTKYLAASTNSFGVNFSSAISAFGFYATDVGDIGSRLTLTLTGSNGSSTLVVPHTIGIGTSTSGSVLYYGFYDLANTYSSITFNNIGTGGDQFAFDDFSVGSLVQVSPQVPEPATWAMMLAGFGAVGGVVRRARRSAAATA